MPLSGAFQAFGRAGHPAVLLGEFVVVVFVFFHIRCFRMGDKYQEFKIAIIIRPSRPLPDAPGVVRECVSNVLDIREKRLSVPLATEPGKPRACFII